MSSNLPYIISNRQSVHILMHNFNNEFCYHVAIVQRLHTSPTINKVVKDLDKRQNLDQYIKDTLGALTIYSQLTIKDILATSDYNSVIYPVYNKLRDWYSNYVSTYVGAGGLHGYMPEILLTCILLPALHEITDKIDFKNILQEINLEPNAVERAKYIYQDIFLGSRGYTKEIFQEQAMKIYEKMLDDIPDKLDFTEFSAAVFEVFPEANNEYSGHAITLIKNDKQKLYVIDDNRVIEPLADYYNAYRERLYKINVRDISNKTAVEINNILRNECKVSVLQLLEARITRYTIDFSNNFVSFDQKLYINPGLAGGCNCKAKNKDKNIRNLDYIIFISLFIIIVIIVIISYHVNKVLSTVIMDVNISDNNNNNNSYNN